MSQGLGGGRDGVMNRCEVSFGVDEIFFELNRGGSGTML